MIDKLNERITIQQSKHMTDKVGNHAERMGGLLHLLRLRFDL